MKRIKLNDDPDGIIARLKDEVDTWKKACEVNSYNCFRLREENKLLTNRDKDLQKDCNATKKELKEARELVKLLYGRTHGEFDFNDEIEIRARKFLEGIK